MQKDPKWMYSKWSARYISALVCRAKGETGTMHILVVEDDRDLANEIGEYFRRRQHRVTTCYSLADARMVLSGATGEEDTPTAVVCDANLPDGNGVDFFTQTSPTYAGRWILMSGAHDQEQLAALGEIGDEKVAIVDKPVSIKELARILGTA